MLSLRQDIAKGRYNVILTSTQPVSLAFSKNQNSWHASDVSWLTKAISYIYGVSQSVNSRLETMLGMNRRLENSVSYWYSVSRSHRYGSTKFRIRYYWWAENERPHRALVNIQPPQYNIRSSLYSRTPQELSEPPLLDSRSLGT